MQISTRNVVQLGFAFFTNFVAFNTQGFIEEPVINSASRDGSVDKHAGYYSLAIIYLFYTLGNLTAAQLVDMLTPKWAMCIGALCYGVFQAGFLFLNSTFLYVSSAILGFGASIIWTGQGSYLSQNCTKETTSRNSALLWGMHESCLLVGGTFIFIVFSVTDSHESISMFTIKILYSVFTVLSILAALIFSMLGEPTYKKEKHENYKKLASSTFNLFFTKRMIFLVVVFCYLGIEQSFWTAIYPTCVSFTRRLGYNTNALLALNLICTGIGQCAAGFIFGILGDKTRKLGRDYIILMGTLIHLVAYTVCMLNYPADASRMRTNDSGWFWEPSITIALLIGVSLGFADACWNTQIMSFLCDTYSGESSQAFAIFKFFESALSCIAFFCSPFISLHFLLSILIILSVLASVSFIIVERLLTPKHTDHIDDLNSQELQKS